MFQNFRGLKKSLLINHLNYFCDLLRKPELCSYKIFCWNGEKTFLKLSTFIDTAAIEKIDVDYDQTLLKLFNGNTDNFVFAKSDVDAEDMSIFVHLAPKDRNTMEVIFNCNYISVYTLLQTYRYTSKEVPVKWPLE